MNKLNPLFEAMNDMDDNVVSEAVKAKKHSIRTKALLVAAVVAVTALIVGFTRRSMAIPGNLEVKVDRDTVFVNEGVILVQMGMRLPTEDEMLEWGAEERGDISKNSYFFHKDGLPGELLEMFNVHPLINDNFTEETTPIDVSVHLITPESPLFAHFYYQLTHKQTGLPVDFSISCSYEIYGDYGDYDLGTEFNLQTSGRESERIEIIDLNDGSNAILWEDTNVDAGTFSEWADAHFVYNGIQYRLCVNGTDIDGMKQILADLGVL